MNALNIWNPLREMDELQNRMAAIFRNTPTGMSREWDQKPLVGQWVPPVDIMEEDKEYVIKAELPEIRKEDVKVNVENRVLTISGERKQESEQKGQRHHRVERNYGAFFRSFTLPEGADEQNINASCENGVLTIRLAKHPQSQRQTLEVPIQ